MPGWLEFILEVVKLTVPGLIVFFTAYYLLKTYLSSQLGLEQVKQSNNRDASSLPIRLQAYERLSLFCERISIPNLLVRVRPEGKTVEELKLTLMLTIQQEYEHNISQQIYVSEQLWDIIKAARDNVVSTITLVAEELPPKEDGRQLTAAIIGLLQQQGETSGLLTAQRAVRKEVTLLFG